MNNITVSEEIKKDVQERIKSLGEICNHNGLPMIVCVILGREAQENGVQEAKQIAVNVSGESEYGTSCIVAAYELLQMKSVPVESVAILRAIRKKQEAGELCDCPECSAKRNKASTVH
ncbi:hypothetical protein [Citrobacter braakii]|uniref:hypothetical protein n=1 Tax=Citrobacter braakii TaxID=57706 RepID=UPI00351D00BA